VEAEEVWAVEDGQPGRVLLHREGRTVRVHNERTGQLSEPREVFAQASSILTTLDYENDADQYPLLLALRQFCEGIEVHKVFDVDGMRFARQPGEASLAPSGDNLQGYLGWLKEHDRPGFERAVALMKRLFPRLQEIDVRAGPWGGRMTGFVERVPHTREALSYRGSQAGDGSLRLLALAALTQRTDPPTLLALEEIENGVHVSLVKGLLRLLAGLASGPQPCQVLVTTHNSFLLDYVKPHHVRVVLRERGRTQVKEIPPNNPYLATGTLHPGELWEFKEEKGLLATPKGSRGG
jgi:predicted ATPase